MLPVPPVLPLPPDVLVMQSVQVDCVLDRGWAVPTEAEGAPASTQVTSGAMPDARDMGQDRSTPESTSLVSQEQFIGGLHVATYGGPLLAS